MLCMPAPSDRHTRKKGALPTGGMAPFYNLNLINRAHFPGNTRKGEYNYEYLDFCFPNDSSKSITAAPALGRVSVFLSGRGL